VIQVTKTGLLLHSVITLALKGKCKTKNNLYKCSIKLGRLKYMLCIFGDRLTETDTGCCMLIVCV
jgi:hypothetical protein